MIQRINKRMRGEGGFTLIELLVVIIIIAILAAIAIPTFLGQRQKAQDAAAKSLVRNAMTSIESAYVDTRTFLHTTAGMTGPDLKLIEPSITFTEMDGGATNAAWTPTAQPNTVNYGGTADSYWVGCASLSGNTFGVYVSKTSGGGNTFKAGTKAVPALADKSW